MRFASVFVAGTFAAMASAQTATASLSPAQQSQMDCIDACDAGDVKCQSYCITVPSPNEKQVNATNECVANCDKGKGTEADTNKYAACLQDCVADNYWKSVDGTPRETNAASNDDDKDSSKAAGSKATATGADDSDSTATGAASASASSDSDDDASETASDSEDATGTASGSASSSTETGNAAPVLVGGVSLLGLAAAVLAL
ncbi:hypothetical protein ACHAPT_010000 [Fusarium lateritium]